MSEAGVDLMRSWCGSTRDTLWGLVSCDLPVGHGDKHHARANEHTEIAWPRDSVEVEAVTPNGVRKVGERQRRDAPDTEVVTDTTAPAGTVFVKHDAGKPRTDLLPPDALLDIAKVMKIGAEKYGASNWCAGPEWSRYYAAAQRHLLAWWAGESTDAESGLSHLAHLGACALILAALEKRQLGTDDRWRKP